MEKKELQIEVEPLKKYRLYIATPSYGSVTGMNFHNSCTSLANLLVRCGIEVEFANMGNESLIPRARNRMVNWFLQKEDYTHLMFIDSDIEFNPIDVISLLHFNKDVIGASYPLKGISWDLVKKAIKKHPDISDEDIEKCAVRWASHLKFGNTEVKPFEPVECLDLATGFTMYKREVFEKLKPVVDSYKTAPNEPGMTPIAYDFFKTGVMDEEYQSEDYGFCKLWKSIGGKLYLCPWIKLNHFGAYGFKGDMQRVIELLGEVH